MKGKRRKGKKMLRPTEPPVSGRPDPHVAPGGGTDGGRRLRTREVWQEVRSRLSCDDLKAVCWEMSEEVGVDGSRPAEPPLIGGPSCTPLQHTRIPP